MFSVAPVAAVLGWKDGGSAGRTGRGHEERVAPLCHRAHLGGMRSHQGSGLRAGQAQVTF